MSKKRRSLLQVENLENRAVPAGGLGADFVVVTNGTNTTISTVDGVADDITLTTVGANMILVTDNLTGDCDTFTVPGTLTLNTSPAGDVVNVDSAGLTLTTDLAINTGAGYDNVNLYGAGTLDRVSIDTSSEGDVVDVQDVTTGNLTVALGEGDNDLYIGTIASVTVSGSVNVTGGSGNDSLYIGSYGIPSDITGNVVFAAGDGDNRLGTDGDLVNQTTIGGSVTMTGGTGNDELYFDRTVVSGSVTFNAGGGDNTLYLEYYTAIGGSLSMTAGAGNDDVTLDDDLSVGSTVNLNLGDGDNDVDFNEAVTIGGSLTVTTGAGNDDIDIEDTTVTGSATLNGGGGTNYFYLEDSYYDGGTAIGGSLSITGGSGDDLVDFNDSGEGLAIGGNLAINLGGGNNTWVLDQDFTVGNNVSLSSTGAFDDTLTLFATTAGTIGGNLSVNLGGGDNDFTFNGRVGSAAKGGYLTYTGGSGNDAVTINGHVFRSLTANLGAGGVNSFTYGLAAIVGASIGSPGTATVFCYGGTFTNLGAPILTTITKRFGCT